MTVLGKSKTSDIGLSSYIARVYGYVAAGLFLSSLSAYFLYIFTLSMPIGNLLYLYMKLGFISFIASMGIIFYISWIEDDIEGSISLFKLQLLYWTFCLLQGVSFATLGIIFTAESIFSVFFITAAMFMSFSLYGYFTKSNLQGMYQFLYLIVWGIFISLLINMLFRSSSLMYIISLISVVVFSVLSAVSTQGIKNCYLMNANRSDDLLDKISVFGAFSLYITFVNLLQFMLYLFGERR